MNNGRNIVLSCEKPNYMLDYGIGKDGKHITRFLPNLGKDNLDIRNLSLLQKMNLDGVTKVFAVPCGKCPSCLKAYRRQWALRCEAEAKLHDKNCFITLTYDDKHNPGVLVKDDLKKFIKKLRNAGNKVRYFGCGEYGKAGLRDKHPHYHLILFGYMPGDLTFICKSKTNFSLFKSRYIESLWSKGLCTVQEFDSAVASYVAGYVEKKVGDTDSFLIMSNRPGIGHDYFIKYIMKLYEHDNYVSKNGYIASLPRYCDKVADQFFYDISDIKEKRIEKAKMLNVSAMNVHGFENFEDIFDLAGSIERSKPNYGRSL